MAHTRTAVIALISTALGVIAFLGTMTAGCDDVDGVPSWERCRSWFGNPIIEWPGGDWAPLWALAIGAGIGWLSYRLLDRITPGR